MYECSHCNKAAIHQQEIKGTEGCVFRALVSSEQLHKISGVSALPSMHCIQVRGLAWLRGAGPLPGKPHVRLLIIKGDTDYPCKLDTLDGMHSHGPGPFPVRRNLSKGRNRVRTDILRKTRAQQ